ncbi:MAG: hypothetical protein ABJP06_04295 [Sulfitobacter sp.]
MQKDKRIIARLNLPPKRFTWIKSANRFVFTLTCVNLSAYILVQILRTAVFVAAKTKCGVRGLGDNMKSFVAIFATAMVFNITSAQARDAMSETQAELVFGGAKLNIQTGSEAAVFAARFEGIMPVCNPLCIAPHGAVAGAQTLNESDVGVLRIWPYNSGIIH